MKILLIAALSVLSFYSMADMYTKSPEEKQIEKQKKSVKTSAEKEKEQLERREDQQNEDAKIEEERMEEQTKIDKEKVDLQKEEQLNDLEAKEKKVD